MILSSFCFAIMQILIHMTGGEIPLMEQIFFRNIISLIVCFFIIRREKLSLLGGKVHQPLLITRSLFGLLSMVSLFYAAVRANQADITILSKLSPFFITLWAFLFLKEKITRVQLVALLMAFLGAGLIANPTMNIDPVPLLMAFLSAVSASVSHTLLSYFKDKVNGITIVMHFSAVCIAISIPFMILNLVLPDTKELVLLLLLGAFGCLGQFALTYSYRMAAASEISIYNYSGIVFSMLLGYLLLDETISFHSLAGGAAIIIASLLVYRQTANISQYDTEK